MEPIWTDVGSALKHRREHLRMTQQAVADAADLSLAIVQMLEASRKDGYRGTTLTAISYALQWPADAIDRLLAGEDPASFPDVDHGLDESDEAAKLAELADAIKEMAEEFRALRRELRGD